MTKPLLLIAIGNTLRTDDGAGHVLADRLEPLLQANGVSVQRVDLHQLVPETAEDIREAGMVVFLDAAIGEKKVVWREIKPSGSLGASPHTFSPDNIITLVEQLYGSVPPAFLFSVPGADFAHGEGLSQTAQEFVDEAVGNWRWLAEAFSKI